MVWHGPSVISVLKKYSPLSRISQSAALVNRQKAGPPGFSKKAYRGSALHRLRTKGRAALVRGL
jgi:hypothetical protein